MQVPQAGPGPGPGPGPGGYQLPAVVPNFQEKLAKLAGKGMRIKKKKTDKKKRIKQKIRKSNKK